LSFGVEFVYDAEDETNAAGDDGPEDDAGGPAVGAVSADCEGGEEEDYAGDEEDEAEPVECADEFGDRGACMGIQFQEYKQHRNGEAPGPNRQLFSFWGVREIDEETPSPGCVLGKCPPDNRAQDTRNSPLHNQPQLRRIEYRRPNKPRILSSLLERDDIADDDLS
jgi:hypothetical protein